MQWGRFVTASRILVYDIENSASVVSTWTLHQPNISINQIIEPHRVLCVGSKWIGERKITVNAEWHDGGHQGMVQAVHALLDEADAVVTYNGRSHDRKHMNAEFLKAGLGPPSPAIEIDLLTCARRFAFPPRKLDYISQALGIGKKVPHSGMQLWNDIERGDEVTKPKAQRKMESYVRGDVRLTEDLYYQLLPWLTTHLNVGVWDEDERPTCNRCGSDDIESRGFAQTNSFRYRRFMCRSCKGWLRGKRCESTTELRLM